jgi:hypothetical protein
VVDKPQMVADLSPIECPVSGVSGLLAAGRIIERYSPLAILSLLLNYSFRIGTTFFSFVLGGVIIFISAQAYNVLD